MKFFIIVALGLLAGLTCASWGFYAHYRINHLAVFTLPPGMSGFYEANLQQLTLDAVSPDRKRYVDSTEGSRHFFDADHYGRDPFHTVPQKWSDAVQKYTIDTLNKYGTLPWAIQYRYYALVKAFKNHDTSAILYHSAYLGHYVADACVPLHTTQNYDGQLTGQNGIHSLWESRLPEHFGAQYNWYAGKAHYIENPLWAAFIICRSSYKSLDTVLRTEQSLHHRFTDNLKYEVVKRGNRRVKEYSAAYCLAYNLALKGMVQRRLKMAIRNVGSFWFSAWVDAGQPNINKLISKSTHYNNTSIKAEKELYIKGKTAPALNILTPLSESQ